MNNTNSSVKKKNGQNPSATDSKSSVISVTKEQKLQQLRERERQIIMDYGEFLEFTLPERLEKGRLNSVSLKRLGLDWVQGDLAPVMLTPEIRKAVEVLNNVSLSEQSVRLLINRIQINYQRGASEFARQITTWYEQRLNDELISLATEFDVATPSPRTFATEDYPVHPLEMDVHLSGFDRWRFMLYGGLAASLTVGMLLPLPSFLTWVFTVPAFIFGLFQGGQLWAKNKRKELKREVSGILTELTRQVQRRAAQDIHKLSEDFENRFIQIRLQSKRNQLRRKERRLEEIKQLAQAAREP